MASNTSAPLRALRVPQVCGVTGLKRTTLYDLEAAGKFPKRVKLSDRCSAWLEHEVQAWLAERVASSRSPARSGGTP